MALMSWIFYGTFFLFVTAVGFVVGIVIAALDKTEERKPPLFLAFFCTAAILLSYHHPAAASDLSQSWISPVIVDLVAFFIAPIIGWRCWDPKKKWLQWPMRVQLRLRK